MKKKGIATLALAGALAVSMVPAFAAEATSNQKTTVGYVVGGNVDPTGKVMVTVPKDVTFTKDKESVTGFDVVAKVWNSTTQNWVTPDAGNGLTLGGDITVTVASANGFKLKNAGQTSEGEYTYKIADTLFTASERKLTDKAPTLSGTVAVTKAPMVAQGDKAVNFTDTLTYTFSGGVFTTQGG